MTGTTRGAGYIRVSTRKQSEQGVSLDDQRARLSREAGARELELQLFTEVASARTLRGRPVLRRLLEQLDAGDYNVLLITRLDRVSRSVGDFAALMDRAHRNGWALVMLDPAVDMTTPFGRAMAQIAAVFAELERALISQRTREGLAEARAQGTFRPGEHLRYTDAETIRRILRWRAGDRPLSYLAICERLELEGVVPPRGEVWHPRTVGRLVARATGGTDAQ